VSKLTAFDGITDNSFSEGGGISGGVIVIGVGVDDSVSGANAGAIYVYE
jgi:hypothetical protein